MQDRGAVRQLVRFPGLGVQERNGPDPEPISELQWPCRPTDQVQHLDIQQRHQLQRISLHRSLARNEWRSQRLLHHRRVPQGKVVPGLLHEPVQRLTMQWKPRVELLLWWHRQLQGYW
jgi:hypothetical protein